MDPLFQLKERDPVSEPLCSLEYWKMGKVQELGNPEIY